MTTTSGGQLRRPRTAAPARGATVWRGAHRAISMIVVGGAATTGIYLGLTGPLLSPVEPAAVDAAGATAGQTTTDVAAAGPAAGDAPAADDDGGPDFQPQGGRGGDRNRDGGRGR